MTDLVSIPETEKQYKDEWLLFEVVESSEQDEPLRGRLLCHHPDQGPIYDHADGKDALDLYITFTGPAVPDGYEAVL